MTTKPTVEKSHETYKYFINIKEFPKNGKLSYGVSRYLIFKWEKRVFTCITSPNKIRTWYYSNAHQIGSLKETIASYLCSDYVLRRPENNKIVLAKSKKKIKGVITPLFYTHCKYLVAAEQKLTLSEKQRCVEIQTVFRTRLIFFRNGPIVIIDCYYIRCGGGFVYILLWLENIMCL